MVIVNVVAALVGLASFAIPFLTILRVLCVVVLAVVLARAQDEIRPRAAMGARLRSMGNLL